MVALMLSVAVDDSGAGAGVAAVVGVALDFLGTDSSTLITTLAAVAAPPIRWGGANANACS